jgi:hypothetical protein
MAAMTGPLAAGLLLAAAPGAGGERDPQIVEQVVAVVRTPASTQARIITLTRLEEEARIALVSRGAAAAAEAALDGPALRAGLEWLIDQILLHDEVVRLQAFEVDRADAQEELRRFQARFADHGAYRAFLARCDMTEEELLVVLRRMVRVQRYVGSRVTGAARVRETEVDRWLAEHGAPEGQDRTAVRAAARARIAEERTASELKALLGELRGRAEVRILETFGGRG